MLYKLSPSLIRIIDQIPHTRLSRYGQQVSPVVEAVGMWITDKCIYALSYTKVSVIHISTADHLRIAIDLAGMPGSGNGISLSIEALIGQ